MTFNFYSSLLSKYTQVSSTTNEEFKRHAVEKEADTPGVDLGVTVLTTGCWSANEPPGAAYIANGRLHIQKKLPGAQKPALK